MMHPLMITIMLLADGYGEAVSVIPPLAIDRAETPPAFLHGILQPAACRGCGCRGGPGYRDNKTGKCVSHKRLKKVCGSPPDKKRCTKENG